MALTFYQPLDDLSIETLSFIALFLTISCYMLNRILKGSRQQLNLPPGPAGLPVIGNMHQLGKAPHYSLWAMSKLHGPIMFLRLGRVPTLVISSAEAAREVLKTHDIAFCSRPPVVAVKKLTYGYHDLAYAPYGDYWREVRKICLIELLSPKRVESLRSVKEAEVTTLLQTISRHASSATPMNLSELFFSLLNNITARAVFGKRYSKEEEISKSHLQETVADSIYLLAAFCTADFFPCMSWLNMFTGLQAKMDRNFREMDSLLEEVIEEHLNRTNLETKQHDLVDFVLRVQKDFTSKIPLSRDHIKAILTDLFIAGTDTTSASLEWAMCELMRNPRVMKKAQAEVRGLLGSKERVEESDLPQLKYLKLVVKEGLRLHPPGGLLIPRQTREECTINGYDIPLKTWVFINVIGISRDPKYWDNPNEFWPERFLGNSIDHSRGQDFNFLTFGAGRRGCPGMSMGLSILELTLANMIHSFDWGLPEGISREMIDVEETDGPTIHKKFPLVVVATASKALVPPQYNN